MGFQSQEIVFPGSVPGSGAATAHRKQEGGESRAPKKQEESHRAPQRLRAANVPGSKKAPGEAAGFME